MDARRLRRSAYPAAALLLVISLVFSLVPDTTAVETEPDAATAALDWLRAGQLDNGAFPGFTGEADPGTTADVVIALAAAGLDPATVTSPAGHDPVRYLAGPAESAAADPGAAARLVLALHAARGDAFNPRDLNGVDLIDAIAGSYDAETGMYGPGIYVSAYAILALRAAGEPVEPGAVQKLLDTQIEDGSWNCNAAPTPGAGDSNTTAIVVQALVAAGAGTGAINAGLDYLATLQVEDGSIAYDASENPLVGDANSTASAIGAYIAAGRDPSAMPNGDAVAALASFQQPSGALTWRKDAPDEDVLATVQAVPSLLGWALPVAPLGAMPAPAPSQAEALQPATGLGLDGCLYLVETFHNLCGPFAQYWLANGGLKIFGYPLTEPYMENGVAVQYFERTRFEHHPGAWPENFDILQGRLGAEQLGLGGD